MNNPVEKVQITKKEFEEFYNVIEEIPEESEDKVAEILIDTENNLKEVKPIPEFLTDDEADQENRYLENYNSDEEVEK